MKFEDVIIGMREGRLKKASYQKYSDTLVEIVLEDADKHSYGGDRELRRYVNGEHMELTANFRKDDLEADWTVEHEILTQVFDQVVVDIRMPHLKAKHELMVYRDSTAPDAVRSIRMKLVGLTTDDFRSICLYHEDGVQVLFPTEIFKVIGEANGDEI